MRFDEEHLLNAIGEWDLLNWFAILLVWEIFIFLSKDVDWEIAILEGER